MDTFASTRASLRSDADGSLCSYVEMQPRVPMSTMRVPVPIASPKTHLTRRGSIVKNSKVTLREPPEFCTGTLAIFLRCQ